MKTQSIANLSSETTSRVWQYLNAKSQVNDDSEPDFFRDNGCGISEKTDPLSTSHEPSDATDSFASSEKSINTPASFAAFLSCVEIGDLPGIQQLFEQGNSEGYNDTHHFFTSVDAKSRTPLHVAAEKGHAKVASFIVSVSPESLGAKLRDSLETPLHVAAKHGHAHVIEAMLTSAARCTVAATNLDSQNQLSGHASLCVFDSCGLTPLHIAAEAGHVESVVCLIRNGADPMHFDQTRISRSALRCAVENRKYQVVDAMVSRCHCDVDSPAGADSLCVLFSEICNPSASLSSNEADESMKMVRFLVEKAGSNVEGAGARLSALHLAALSNRDDVVRFLVCDRGMSPNRRASPQHQSTPLHFAARASATKAIRELVCNLNANASLGDSDGLTPLHLAALVGARPSIECLIKECGVDINLAINGNVSQRAGHQKNGITLFSLSNLRPIHCAVLSGNTDTVKMLAHDCGADLTVIAENHDKEGFSPLHLASALGFVNVIGELLENGVDLSELTPKLRDTILHTATRYDQLEVVHALLTDAGLHEIANDVNAEGDTPFFIALEKGNIAIVSVLVNYGYVRVDSRNKTGETSLTILARNNLPRRIEFMVGRLNADLQLSNADGSHALHLAAQLGHQEVVRCLIELGCNPKMEDQKKDTAMGIAKKHSHQKVVEYLNTLRIF